MTATDVPSLFSGSAAPQARPAGLFLSRADRRWLFVVLSGLLAARLLAVAWLPFVDTTEARYAEIARKMVETGDWITPQFDYGVPFWGKPPLHTWLSALGMKIFGVNPFGARILILASAVAVLGLLFGWVHRNRGIDQALLATAVLASSALFYGASAFVMTDMAMVLGTTLSMVAFHTCATDPRTRRLWGHLFFVGVAIGLLAKGPVALVVTAIPILGWLALEGRWRRGLVLPWRSGLLVAALLTLPWYVAAEIKTPGFLRYFLIGEHFDRFVVPGWQGDLYGSGHARPKGMIWLYGLATFLPWTLFALALIARPRALADSLRSAPQGWSSYLALWTLSPLLLFTPAANILAAYALPALPPAAVLLVSLWAGARGAPGRWERRAAVAAMTAAAGLLLAVSILSGVMPQTLRLKTERELVAAAQGVDPAIHLTYWGSRSYSAEFYTAGKVDFIADAAQISLLAANQRRDGVAIPQADAQTLAAALAPGFTRVGSFGRRILFVETPNTEIGR
ncbi:glycosyltransferase family 39 protein [Paracoccus subflavus]|uniref:Glycosyltransferase family 39 protein n=1 Tax=Paracoccus subflavus TaxID=2528244 RepID=A0A4Q9GA63_9RHOB|nr:glycosyltransferase family 39 protein [Paracoccus subflavus]TBN43665.1 glycosyltransferase family 39 protein [Paracoccus subflavus]